MVHPQAAGGGGGGGPGGSGRAGVAVAGAAAGNANETAAGSGLQYRLWLTIRRVQGLEVGRGGSSKLSGLHALYVKFRWQGEKFKTPLLRVQRSKDQQELSVDFDARCDDSSPSAPGAGGGKRSSSSVGVLRRRTAAAAAAPRYLLTYLPGRDAAALPLELWLSTFYGKHRCIARGSVNLPMAVSSGSPLELLVRLEDEDGCAVGSAAAVLVSVAVTVFDCAAARDDVQQRLQQHAHEQQQRVRLQRQQQQLEQQLLAGEAPLLSTSSALPYQPAPHVAAVPAAANTYSSPAPPCSSSSPPVSLSYPYQQQQQPRYPQPLPPWQQQQQQLAGGVPAAAGASRGAGPPVGVSSASLCAAAAEKRAAAASNDAAVRFIRGILPQLSTSEIEKALQEAGGDREKTIDLLLNKIVAAAAAENQEEVHALEHQAESAGEAGPSWAQYGATAAAAAPPLPAPPLQHVLQQQQQPLAPQQQQQEPLALQQQQQLAVNQQQQQLALQQQQQQQQLTLHQQQQVAQQQHQQQHYAVYGPQPQAFLQGQYQQPYPPNGFAPAPLYAAVKKIQPSGRRKALLIGINYRGMRAQLRGCINDVHRMKNLLCVVYGFQDSSTTLVVLTDDSPDPLYRPTRKNIQKAMRWLTLDNRPGDSLFFHFSGHGGRAIDKSGLEPDGFDETILPLDYEVAGHIVDDELHAYLVQPLQNGCRLTAVMDSCHSGTGLDLPFTWDGDKWRWEEEINPFFVLGDVQMFSGCADDETSADLGRTQERAPGGAMTTAFISVLSARPFGHSYPSLMESLKEHMIARGLRQRPQLSASQTFEFDRPFNLSDIVANQNRVLGRQVRRKRKPLPARFAAGGRDEAGGGMGMGNVLMLAGAGCATGLLLNSIFQDS